MKRKFQERTVLYIAYKTVRLIKVKAHKRLINGKTIKAGGFHKALPFYIPANRHFGQGFVQSSRTGRTANHLIIRVNLKGACFVPIREGGQSTL